MTNAKEFGSSESRAQASTCRVYRAMSIDGTKDWARNFTTHSSILLK